MKPGEKKSDTADNCEYCGRRYASGRLTTKKLITEFLDTTFSFDRGFLKTFWSLVVEPKVVISSYLEGKRNLFMLPSKYVVVSVTIGVIGIILTPNQFIDLTVTGTDQQTSSHLIQSVLGKLKQIYNVVLFAMIPVVAFVTWVIFNPKKYNYAENLIVCAYLIGQFNLLTGVGSTVDAGLIYAGALPLFGILTNLGAVGVLIYGLISFYQGKTWLNVIKALFIFGFILFIMLIVVLGLAYYMIEMGEVELPVK